MGNAAFFAPNKEIPHVQSERAQAFIEETTKLPATVYIPCRGLFKRCDVAFSILEAGEELDWDEIAMPVFKYGLASVFSRDIVHAVMCKRRDVSIAAVNGEGMDPRYSRK